MDNFIHASWNDQNVNTTLHVHFSKSCKAIEYKASSHYIYVCIYFKYIHKSTTHYYDVTCMHMISSFISIINMPQ